MSILSVQEISKSFKLRKVVKTLSLEIRSGEVVGLLGPNGAGKTSTLECLEGLRPADGGAMDILGVNPAREPRRLRDLIGVQLQTSALPDVMTPDEAMRLFCAYHHTQPRYDLLERLGLGGKRRTQYQQLSTGQKRRLALALAIAHDPPVLFLDEPTAGLDVGSRAELHRLMQECRAQGAAIVLATHDMAEAEKMADRVAILLNGAIVATGTPRELTAAGSGLTKVSVRSERDILRREDRQFPAVRQQMSKDDYAVYFSADPGPTVTGILDYLRQEGDSLIDLRVERPSLEERFLEITHNGGQ